MVKILSDKAQKRKFKQIASKNPDKYYPTNALKHNGFIRKQCNNCKGNFWTSVQSRENCGEPECNQGFTVVENNPSKNKLSYIGVWKKIVEILKPRGYEPIKRYPVVSRWNPTTEFTIASIAAFQPYVVSGNVPPPAKKLVIPQFCLRFSDIENVGITGSHCTGFVMIGQHQFLEPNEWDQDQAFQDIYDFLVDGVGLDKSEFVVSEDAWAGAGCFGPCMEFFSRGVELFNQVYTLFQQTPDGPVGLDLKVLDMGLGMERVAWFCQGTPNMYEAIFPEVLSRIRKITDIHLDHNLYNRFSQYSAFLNIDEVEDINVAWKNVGKEMGMDPEKLKNAILPMTAMYSIAEHSRSLLFAISDGKLPSNVGGGYNLRVIFRRAMAFIDRFNWEINLGEVCQWHAEELRELFPEISNNLNEVKQVLEVEKDKYYTTKKEAEKIVERLIKKSKSKITEDKLIELYDSNGIDPEIIKDAAKKLGKEIKIPDNFYAKVMARHETSQKQIHATRKAINIDIEGLPPTTSLYFDNHLDLENSAKVLKISEVDYEFENDEDIIENQNSNYFKKSIKLKVWAVILNKSIAYPTSGGQLHDNGTINDLQFIDVIKVGGCIVHILSEKPSFTENDTVNIKIDKNRREILTKHHSATHIINAAAREILGKHINQAGAKKTLEKAHLDITHYNSLSDKEINRIEKRANEIVKVHIKTNNRFMSRNEAEKKYGMSLYQGGAVPGFKLRIVEIPGIEIEACGGTHVNNTAEVGRIKIIKSQKIQDGIVRLTYTAGSATEKILEQYKQYKIDIANILETKTNYIESRADELLEKWKSLRKAKKTGKYARDCMYLTREVKNIDQLNNMAKKFGTSIELLVPKLEKLKIEWETMKNKIERISNLVGEENIDNLIANSEDINDFKYISSIYQNVNNNILTNICKKILKKRENIVIFMIGQSDKGFNFVAQRGSNLKKINLSKLTKDFLKVVNGKGGGKPDSTQGFISGKEDFSGDIINKFKKFLLN